MFDAAVALTCSLFEPKHSYDYDVVVIPGFLTGENSVSVLTTCLRNMGFSVDSWGQGFNVGLYSDVLDCLIRHIAANPKPVVLIGWSLGGYYARAAAAQMPNKTKAVITLGTPFQTTDQGAVSFVYQAVTNQDPNNLPKEIEDIVHTAKLKPIVPSACFWTASDGVVDGAACQCPHSTNYETHTNHFGLVQNYGVIRKLAQYMQNNIG